MRTRFVSAVLLAVALAGCFEAKTVTPAPKPPASASEFVQVLASAYHAQDYGTYSQLFTEDFVFILDDRGGVGDAQWDRETELRLHRRMFDPDQVPMGDPAIDPEHWLQTVTITLSQEASFIERPDLYTTNSPPGTLDPSQWIAREAVYAYDVFFQLQGEVDYAPRGRMSVVVIEDRSKRVGEAAKFLIYRWEDLGNFNAFATEESGWGSVKALFI